MKIEVRTKQAPSTNYEYSHREKFKSLKNLIVKKFSIIWIILTGTYIYGQIMI